MSVTTTMAIHEIKDHLSSVIARLTETGEAVEITKHGRVVAVLMPPAPRGVVLGVGARPHGRAPDMEDLRWTEEELADMSGGPIDPP